MLRASVLVAVLLATPHPLTSDVVTARQAAAVAWSAKHGAVKLAWPDALSTDDDGAPDCVELRAPAPASCGKSVWACRAESMSALCTGDFTAERRVVFVESDGPPADDAIARTSASQPVGLLVRAESGNDAPELECSRGTFGMGFGPGVTPAERARAEAEARKRAERDEARCIREAKARQARDAMTLRCALLVVNPCRREVFARCTGKNLGEEDDAPTPGVHRFTWPAP